MRPSAVRRLLLPLLAAPLLLWPAPVSATSCAAVEGPTPEQVAAGDDDLGGRRFFPAYDYGLVGTVEAVSHEPQGPATTRFRVVGVLGRDSVPPTVDVASPDPGWMNGYGFVVGTSYFVPLAATGPDGRRHFSFVCDPISVLADPVASFDRAAAIAEQRGMPYARPSQPPAATPTVTVRETGGGVSATTAVVGGTAGLAGVAGACVLLARRRRAQPPPPAATIVSSS